MFKKKKGNKIKIEYIVSLDSIKGDKGAFKEYVGCNAYLECKLNSKASHLHQSKKVAVKEDGVTFGGEKLLFNYTYTQDPKNQKFDKKNI